MLNAALAIIHDEHRSLAAVIHGLRYLVHDIREREAKPDFRLLWAMIFYLDEFPEKMHHPKENAYLFARLRQRTHEADAVVTELERQHQEGARHVRELERALGHYEADLPDGLDQFSTAVEKFAEETLKHMALEESTVIPLAKAHLTAGDWVEIAAAFGENGDPRFDAGTDHECRDLFSRIVNLAPPPIGVGPAK
ncbi:MAG: hemerythrin domain-containing protein [Burkholderiaceae bacterium]|nr:hemerythrin domain-containing protein [Sulfuritalea sp.]MCF8174651.1 hemerythrin domain-containing protein [Burkholderiaceae bacterium]MCF8184943.1 hemerythrin domain-containing protein [Polynucleobacter sp.]